MCLNCMLEKERMRFTKIVLSLRVTFIANITPEILYDFLKI